MISAGQCVVLGKTRFRQYYSYSVTCQPVESLVRYKAMMIFNHLLQLLLTKKFLFCNSTLQI